VVAAAAGQQRWRRRGVARGAQLLGRDARDHARPARRRGAARRGPALVPRRAARGGRAVARFVALAQGARVDIAAQLPPRVLRPVRAPLWFTAQRWMLGSAPGGYVPPNERWAHEVALPEFEIDAQPVTWQQFAEFVADGGYDDPAWWDDAGRQWLQSSGRRSPRDVEQLRHGVVLQRFGRLVRASAGEAASMLTLHEAQAWCRWARRRLPTEVEWELAASRGASRGFVWGDVAEWTAGAARPWSGDGAVAVDRSLRAQRGLAWFEPRSLAQPKARRFMAAHADQTFVGFRSCAL
jgi:iron(II)-dependent oxidoreductase